MDWKKLLESISASGNEDLRLRNAYLLAENRILREQISGRVQLTDSERKELAETGAKLGKKALEEIATVVKPDTILAWNRQLSDRHVDASELHKFVGRPCIDKEIEDLVVRMARENRSWGYDRIQGALKHLGYTISDQTVGNILQRHGVPPAPERKQTTTWQEFVRFHLDVLSATDFFNQEVWSWLRLVISSFLFFCLHCDGRKIRVAVIIAWRDACWMLPRPRWCRLWHRDVERWERVVIKKGVSRRLLSGTGICRPVLSECATHDCLDRPPQGMGKVVLLPPAHCCQIRDGPMRFQQRCSGLLSSSYREAA